MANTGNQTCPQCGAPLDLNVAACKYCGAEITAQPQYKAPQPQAQQSGQYVQQPNQYIQQSNQYGQPNQYGQSNQYRQPNQYAQQAPPYMQQGQPPYTQQQAPIYSQTVVYTQGNNLGYPPYKMKSKVAAGLLGIFLGGFGIHKFYTGHILAGIIYLLFCWTYIPAFIGLIEGIIYLCASDENFNMKYVRRKN